MANQVPCEPKSPLPRRVWKPKQKSPTEASGVATPKPCLSREEKGKKPLCSSNAADHEVTTAIIPSPNSRAATPCVSLVHINKATAPQRAPLSSASSAKFAPIGEAETEALFSANPFCRDKRSRTSSYVRPKRAFAPVSYTHLTLPTIYSV